MKRTLLFIGAVCLVAGCGSSRAILYRGVASPLGGRRSVITDSAALRDVRTMRLHWVGRARTESRRPRLAAQSQDEFRRRLAAFAIRYGFVVKQVQFRHAGRETPLVVVATSRYLAFSQAVPTIERSLDPHHGRNDATGWRFAAFFLEAVDERGVPFLAVQNFSGGGGEWARSEELYPFLHL